MSDKISEGRRRIVIGGLSAFALSPFMELSFQVKKYARDPFVSPFDEELNFEIMAIEYFRKNYSKKAGNLASLAFDCYRKYGKDGYPYDPVLFLAQIRQESNFGDPRLFISPVGAMGSTQVMPDTAEKEPFNLKVVYNPPYYKEARKVHRNYSSPLRKSFYRVLEGIQKITENPEFETIYKNFDGYRNKWGFIDTKAMPHNVRNRYEESLKEAREEFFGKMGRGLSDKGFDYLLNLHQYDEFREKLDEVHALYEDELGLLIFKNYGKGYVKRMRNDMELKPLDLKPKEKLLELEQRACDESVLPGSYKEMQRLIKKFEGNSLLAVAAYNAGEGRIRNRKLPYIIETINYISWVFHNHTTFRNDLGLK